MNQSWAMLFCAIITQTSFAGISLEEGLAAYDEKNYAQAAQILPKYLEGSTEAQWAMVNLYAEGLGVKQDKEAAIKLARDAATHRHIPAALYLAKAYKDGNEVKADFQRAITWYRKAALYGDLETQVYLGELYENGEGVKKNHRESQKWFLKAAEQGHAKAQRKLGEIYEEGRGTQQNHGAAIKWYSKAAEQGDAVAQFALGRYYASGIIVEKDFAKALLWMNKASKQGFAEAENEIDGLKSKLACIESSKTNLFGELLNCTDRESLRLSLKTKGIKILKENDHLKGDWYDPSRLEKGAAELYIEYSGLGLFMFARYKYPSDNDPLLVQRVKQKIQKQYGKPTETKGFVRQGKVAYIWNLSDGLTIKAYRYWPDTTTFVEYVKSDTSSTITSNQ